jgi:hypothetical protein
MGIEDRTYMRTEQSETAVPSDVAEVQSSKTGCGGKAIVVLVFLVAQYFVGWTILWSSIGEDTITHSVRVPVWTGRSPSDPLGKLTSWEDGTKTVLQPYSPRIREASYRREPFVLTREVVALRFNGSFYGIGLSRRYFDSPVVSWGALLVGLVVLGGVLAPSSSSTPSSQD